MLSVSQIQIYVSADELKADFFIKKALHYPSLCPQRKEMTTKGVEGAGKASLLAGCRYGEVNPRDFIVLFRIFEKFANISFGTEKMMSQDLSALCRGGQCSDLQASASRDKIKHVSTRLQINPAKRWGRRC